MGPDTVAITMSVVGCSTNICKTMSEINLGTVQSLPNEIEVVSWCDHGQESFDGHAEFWLPAHIRVCGNWDDFDCLKALSDWMDDNGFRVHERATSCRSGQAVLVDK